MGGAGIETGEGAIVSEACSRDIAYFDRNSIGTQRREELKNADSSIFGVSVKKSFGLFCLLRS
jgi:hypothetical protein